MHLKEMGETVIGETQKTYNMHIDVREKKQRAISNTKKSHALNYSF